MTVVEWIGGIEGGHCPVRLCTGQRSINGDGVRTGKGDTRVTPG